MRTVGMGVKKEDPDAKLRAELEVQIEHNADLMAENAKLRAELECKAARRAGSADRAQCRSDG